jgi:hypothetical protein
VSAPQRPARSVGHTDELDFYRQVDAAPATDIENPDVIDDAVGELIELVPTRGGWIAFTGPGALDQHLASLRRSGPDHGEHASRRIRAEAAERNRRERR